MNSDTLEQVPMFSGGCIYISQIQSIMEYLKFSMQTHLTHINTIFEYCHASMNLDNVIVLYLEIGNVYTPVLKK